MKKYKVYNGNVRHNIVGYSVPVQIERQNKHRDEIVDYLDNMDEPTISVAQVNGEDVVTFSFTPLTEQMAEWFVNSKTVFFNVVRDKVSNSKRSHYYKRKNKPSLNKIKKTFDIDFADDTCGQAVSIPNTQQDRANRTITSTELTRGYIVRNINYLKNFNIGKHHYDNYAYDVRDESYDDCPKYKNRFYIGFVYFDDRNIPTNFKLCYYECEMNY